MPVSAYRVNSMEPVYQACTLVKSTMLVPIAANRANAGNVIVRVTNQPTVYDAPAVIVVPTTPARPVTDRLLNVWAPFGELSKIRSTRVQVVPDPVHEPCHVPELAVKLGADDNCWLAVIVTV